MKKFNEFSISAFVATVPEVKEFEKSSVARFCLSVSHTENKGDEKSTKTALLPVEKWISNDKKDELKDLKVSTLAATDSSSPTHGKRMARSAARSSSLSPSWKF